MTTHSLHDIFTSMRSIILITTIFLAIQLHSKELVVSAAYSLKEPLNKLSKIFETRHPNTKIILNYAGSGTLAMQIIAGAPVDLFISASEIHMSKLPSEIVSRKSYLPINNSIVVVTHKKNTVTLNSEIDLLKKNDLKVAIGNPKTVPAGHYAMQSLIHSKLTPKITNRLIHTEHVRQAISYVIQKEVDFGLVYHSEAVNYRDKLKTLLALDTSTHDPIRYPVVMLKNSKSKQLALSFLKTLKEEESLKIFSEHGFKR